jgi:hypothetical protein
MQGLSKRTDYDDEDIRDNFCPSVHYLAHTEVRSAEEQRRDVVHVLLFFLGEG